MKSMGIVDLPFSKARYVGSVEAANNSTILNGNSTVGAVNLTVLNGNSTILDNATVFDDLTVPGNSTVLNNLTVSGVAEPTSESEANFSETYSAFKKFCPTVSIWSMVGIFGIIFGQKIEIFVKTSPKG